MEFLLIATQHIRSMHAWGLLEKGRTKVVGVEHPRALCIVETNEFWWLENTHKNGRE